VRSVALCFVALLVACGNGEQATRESPLTTIAATTAAPVLVTSLPSADTGTSATSNVDTTVFTAAPTTVPAPSNPSTSPSESNDGVALDPPSATTAPFPDVPETIIDLTQPAPALAPTPLASYPWPVGDDSMPGLVVAEAGPDQFAVLATTSGVIDFLDSRTGQVVRSEQLAISPGSKMCCLLVGPDDIVYVNHLEGGTPQFVAYAPIAGAYVEVARQPHGVGDSAILLGPRGIGVVGVDPPLMPFVGADGQPSGATLDIEPLRFDAEGRLGRGESVWDLAYPGGRCEGCSSTLPGPGTSVVIVDGFPDGGSTAFRLTVLDEQEVSMWDTDWLYVGPLDNALLMQRIVGDQIEIGIVHL
jgi:hypothetical protein